MKAQGLIKMLLWNKAHAVRLGEDSAMMPDTPFF